MLLALLSAHLPPTYYNAFIFLCAHQHTASPQQYTNLVKTENAIQFINGYSALSFQIC